ncbi:6-phosphogluconate dehydrogenase, C-terminal-like [Pseudocohnilembus persalinus]|uniref:6-phosphogluconate dehydrogenase, C-terminal-like n=1 Tax=Pseudocohnilembus persalinus TaxID=266149 RepID=A0A0V0QLU9_PSEPJ|nr:6-phosphogluconate dehydrogenase, C-terminal-like [Pseudocohnilembus persalinus]|eukprot:KRX03227.1 6-phosphogluconate dehydrogenase, C-terminal-like [Pseudocohnilembus persalinus]
MFKNIGWIGTGVMGKNMCKHLIHKNFDLNIFNRTATKAQELQGLGANFMQPEEIAKKSKVIFLMLGYPEDVENMVFQKLYPHLQKGQIIVDHTTSSPDLAAHIYQELKKKQVISVDAPVTGGDIGAIKGTLTIMCGGPEKTVEDLKTPMNCYASNINYIGEAGMGQHCKLGNQIVIASNMIATVEGLLYAHKAGLDLNRFIDIIKNGSAGSSALMNLGPRMVRGDFEPGFYVEHFIKDMDLALKECEKMNLKLPGLEQSRTFYQRLVEKGAGKDGTQAIIKVLEELNGFTIRD